MSSQRRQMMQPWPLCLMDFSKSKDRSILPKQYQRVPSIARSSTTSSSLASDCASSNTIATNVSPFNSQITLLADKKASSGSQAKKHYYGENLKQKQNSFDKTHIYDPIMSQGQDADYKQIYPLLDEHGVDATILMVDQVHEKKNASQFQKEMRPSKPNYFSQVLAALSVSLGSMVVGYASSYTSPALVSMNDRNITSFEVDEQAKSWIAGIMPLCALFGGIAGGPFIEYLGRRNTILGTALPFIGAWLLIAQATGVAMILVGRALCGFCVGVASLALPVYLGETLQPEVRGTLGLLPTALGNIGILLCYTTGNYLEWRNLALLGAALPVPFMVLMFLIPETPRWHISKGKTKNARKALQWLRGKNTDVSDELTAVEKTHVDSERNATQGTLMELLKIHNAKPLLISLGLMFFQQMSGINAVMFYTVQIFEDAGSSVKPNISTIIVGIVNFGSTFMATILIDRLGRKILLYTSSISMAISLIVLGGYFHMQPEVYNEAVPILTTVQNMSTVENMASVPNMFTVENMTAVLNMTTLPNMDIVENITTVLTSDTNKTALSLAARGEFTSAYGWLPLASFIVYVIGFSLGFGPIPWLMMGEILPAKIRGSAASITTGFNWTCTFIVTKTFTDLMRLMGSDYTFWMFALVCIVGLIFVIIFVPETRGRSLEEIEKRLTGPVRRMSAVANMKPMPMGC